METLKKNGENLNLGQKLGIASLLGGQQKSGFADSSLVNKLFHNLEDRINQAAQGAVIDLEADKYAHNGYRRFTLNADGLTVAQAVTLVSKKVQGIQGHYLFFIHTDPFFQRKGLAGQLLANFKIFLEDSGEIGLLDNIIPSTDPAAGMYQKQGWQSLGEIIGHGTVAALSRKANGVSIGAGRGKEEAGHPMVYVPARWKSAQEILRRALPEIFYQLQSKHDLIAMRQNEIFVAQTISEFKEMLSTLLVFFQDEIEAQAVSPLARYLFTRLAVKLAGFKRSIVKLAGYTGGDSIEQIAIPLPILSLPIQSYEPPAVKNKRIQIDGDWQLWMKLPRTIQEFPAQGIEALPNYFRPSLAVWLEERGKMPSYGFMIRDILSLGYDPTRLKEIPIDGEPHIFERLRLGALPAVNATNGFLAVLQTKLRGARAQEAFVRFNPPVLTIQDSGNAYVLRRKVNGVHYDEAVNLLERYQDRIFGAVARKILATVRSARELAAGLDAEQEKNLTYFVPWDLEHNQPKIMVDWSGLSYLEEVIIS